MTDTIVARRYAGALFALGKKQGTDALDAHGQCLGELAGIIRAQPKLAMTLKSPVIGISEKKALLDAILKQLPADATMRNFCFLLADKKRLDMLCGIAEWYGIMLDEINGVLRGRVTTAIKLKPEAQTRLKDDLEKKLGRAIELKFSVDPEILGGMVLTVGDKVLDSSLRAQLGILRETLKKGL